MKYILAVIEGDRRLTVWSQGKLAWLEGEKVSVAEAIADGCLFVTTLGTWAAQKGIKPEDAEQALGSPEEADIEPPMYPGTSLGRVVRNRKTRSASYTFSLGDLALWNLLGAGAGPLQGKLSRSSAPVLVRVVENGLYVWSKEARGMRGSGALSFFTE